MVNTGKWSFETEKTCHYLLLIYKYRNRNLTLARRHPQLSISPFCVLDSTEVSKAHNKHTADTCKKNKKKKEKHT